MKDESMARLRSLGKAAAIVAAASASLALVPAPAWSHGRRVATTQSATVAASGRGGVAAVAAVVTGVDGFREVPAGCHIAGRSTRVRPDAGCTPGATNPEVNQGNIQGTICAHGWTSTIRPPSSWTGSLKSDQMAAWGISGDRSRIEEDHLISLELGGAPKDSRNLWPEKGGIPNPKDRLENLLRSLVCSSQLSLVDAQNEIAGNWVRSYRGRFGAPPPIPTSPPPTTTPPPPPPTTTPGNGATALCRDGTYSYSKTHSGTCSGHGGVAVWYR